VVILILCAIRLVALIFNDFLSFRLCLFDVVALKIIS